MSSESEVENDYLLAGALFRDSPTPSPTSPQSRNLEMLAVHRVTAKTTTIASSTRHVIHRRGSSDAQIQTSLALNDKKGVQEDPVSSATIVSHLEVPLSLFEDSLFPRMSELPHLDAAATELLLNEEFQRTVQSYVEAMGEDEEQSAMRQSGQDVEDLVIKILTMIVDSYPNSETVRPHDIVFRDETHFDALSEPHGPPAVAGVFASDDPRGLYHWKDVAILFDNGMAFEEEYQEILVRREREASARRSLITSPKSPPRSVSRPSGALASSSSQVVPIPTRSAKRPRLDTQHLKSGSDGPIRSAVSNESVSTADQSATRKGPKPPEELERCAQEALSASGNRRHILGITIHELIIRLWYFDRAGTIYTPPIQLNDKSFIMAFIRLISGDSAQLGFEETLQSPNVGMAGFSSSRITEVVGCTLNVHGSSFVIREKLHSASEVYGRGTTVYAASRLGPGGSDDGGSGSLLSIPDDVVIKLSWQLTNWGSEDALYRLAAEKGVRGLSHLYRSAHITRLSLGFRRRLVNITQYRDRELRVQVLGPLAIPLHRVKELSVFKAAFTSLVEDICIITLLQLFLTLLVAHHDLYSKTGVLHHDISPNNLMVDAKDHSVGVLIDLDLAVRLYDGEQRLPINFPLGGTLPFRAIHVLLQGDKIRELYYRHDLESFFYSLVWILTYHPLDSSPPAGNLSAWYKGPNPHAIGRIKRGHLIEMQNGEDLPEGPLKEHWLRKLAVLFDTGFQRIERKQHAVDRDTLGGYVTYRAFMSILNAPSAT